jgi:hypothetical protein
MKFQIPNSKFQTIPNPQFQMTKTCQILSFGDLDFGHWSLFGIWCLVLGISSCTDLSISGNEDTLLACILMTHLPDP